jgi:hypothetical protein
MKHKSKELTTVFRQIEAFGFRIETTATKSSHTIKVFAPQKSQGIYVVHPGERAIHPLLRFVKNCGYFLD